METNRETKETLKQVKRTNYLLSKNENKDHDININLTINGSPDGELPGTDCSSVQNQVDALEDDVAVISDKVDDLVDNANNVNDNVGDINSSITTITADVASNTQSIAEHSAKLDDHETSINTNKSEISTLKTDVSDNTYTLDLHEGLIKTNIYDISQNRAKTITNKDEIDTNSASISTHTTTLDDHSSRIKTLEDQAIQFSSDLLELQNKVNAISPDDNQGYQEQIDLINSELDAIRRDIDNIALGADTYTELEDLYGQGCTLCALHSTGSSQRVQSSTAVMVGEDEATGTYQYCYPALRPFVGCLNFIMFKDQNSMSMLFDNNPTDKYMPGGSKHTDGLYDYANFTGLELISGSCSPFGQYGEVYYNKSSKSKDVAVHSKAKTSNNSYEIIIDKTVTEDSISFKFSAQVNADPSSSIDIGEALFNLSEFDITGIDQLITTPQGDAVISFTYKFDKDETFTPYIRVSLPTPCLYTHPIGDDRVFSLPLLYKDVSLPLDKNYVIPGVANFSYSTSDVYQEYSCANVVPPPTEDPNDPTSWLFAGNPDVSSMLDAVSFCLTKQNNRNLDKLKQIVEDAANEDYKTRVGDIIQQSVILNANIASSVYTLSESSVRLQKETFPATGQPNGLIEVNGTWYPHADKIIAKKLDSGNFKTTVTDGDYTGFFNTQGALSTQACGPGSISIGPSRVKQKLETVGNNFWTQGDITTDPGTNYVELEVTQAIYHSYHSPYNLEDYTPDNPDPDVKSINTRIAKGNFEIVVEGYTAPNFGVNYSPQAHFELTCSFHGKTTTVDLVLDTPTPIIDASTGLYQFVFPVEMDLSSLAAHLSIKMPQAYVPKFEKVEYRTDEFDKVIPVLTGGDDGKGAYTEIYMYSSVSEPRVDVTKTSPDDRAWGAEYPLSELVLSPSNPIETKLTMKEPFDVERITTPVTNKNVIFDGTQISNSISNIKTNLLLMIEEYQQNQLEKRVEQLEEASNPSFLRKIGNAFVGIASMMTPCTTMAITLAIGVGLGFVDDIIQHDFVKGFIEAIAGAVGVNMVLRSKNVPGFSSSEFEAGDHDPVASIETHSQAGSLPYDDPEITDFVNANSNWTKKREYDDLMDEFDPVVVQLAMEHGHMKDFASDNTPMEWSSHSANSDDIQIRNDFFGEIFNGNQQPIVEAIGPAANSRKMELSSVTENDLEYHKCQLLTEVTEPRNVRLKKKSRTRVESGQYLLTNDYITNETAQIMRRMEKKVGEGDDREIWTLEKEMSNGNTTITNEDLNIERRALLSASGYGKDLNVNWDEISTDPFSIWPSMNNQFLADRLSSNQRIEFRSKVNSVKKSANNTTMAEEWLQFMSSNPTPVNNIVLSAQSNAGPLDDLIDLTHVVNPLNEIREDNVNLSLQYLTNQHKGSEATISPMTKDQIILEAINAYDHNVNLMDRLGFFFVRSNSYVQKKYGMVPSSKIDKHDLARLILNAHPKRVIEQLEKYRSAGLMSEA